MPRITVEISVAESLALDELIVVLNESQSNTHGNLNRSKLMAMLVSDAAMVVSRSGSWEAANMRELLQSHGYRG